MKKKCKDSFVFVGIQNIATDDLQMKGKDNNWTWMLKIFNNNREERVGVHACNLYIEKAKREWKK